MTPSWSLGIDALLALLLIGTIVMAVRLDGALRVIRRDRGVFEALIVNLSSATESVKLGIQALREEADRAARHIEQRSQEADKMATDLSFLIEAADRAGARLEERFRSVRPLVTVPVRESKSVRIARKLRAGREIPKRRKDEVSIEAPTSVSTSGPKIESPPLPILTEAQPALAGQGSRLGSLFGQAGITTRRRSQAVGATSSETVVGSDMLEVSRHVAPTKKMG